MLPWGNIKIFFGLIFADGEGVRQVGLPAAPCMCEHSACAVRRSYLRLPGEKPEAGLPCCTRAVCTHSRSRRQTNLPHPLAIGKNQAI